jgi:glucosamine--fructose-6-phosphate aminotransferase (isomerizing)
MCGIVSYIGDKPAQAILLEGLKSLEYRGYDSSGIAVLSNDAQILIQKSKGKIADLENKILSNEQTAFISSTCGIGHTRWATHGEPNEINAHPHTDSSGEIALVHNGIIKNYLELKEELEKEGYKFNTETDTEVITQLFSKYRQEPSRNRKDKGSEDLAALRATVKRLEGSYAIAILVASKNAAEQKILIAKNESPLVVGIGEGENFIASDSATILQFTDKILRLKDRQLAELTASNVRVENFDGQPVKSEIQQLVRTSSLLEKGAYKHFLLKEIYEQPSVIRLMLQDDKAFSKLDIDLSQIKRIIFVACGSAYHAALIGKYLIELWSRTPVEIAVASEYIDKTPILDESALVIGISQSGETADTLGAVRTAQKAKAKTLAITNRGDSALAELCLPNVYVTPAGTEVSVASTKAFSSQVMALYLLALQIAEQKNSLSKAEINKIKQELHCIPQLVDQTIERSENLKDIFTKYSTYRDFLFLSRGINYPIALEGALKLKELSYIHATGYPSGEMKHGPIAILDETVSVLNIAISGPSEQEKNIYQKTLHNAEEARARKSPSLVIACDDNRDVEGLFNEVIRIPNISQIFSPIVAVIPLQFLAYYIAEHLGKDVDQPRNLAKSVTVE